jgi:hypothetical protein
MMSLHNTKPLEQHSQRLGNACSIQLSYGVSPAQTYLYLRRTSTPSLGYFPSFSRTFLKFPFWSGENVGKASLLSFPASPFACLNSSISRFHFKTLFQRGRAIWT